MNMSMVYCRICSRVAKKNASQSDALLLEPPLGIPSPVDPVGLVECHLRCTKQGVIDSFYSQHELETSA